MNPKSASALVQLGGVLLVLSVISLSPSTSLFFACVAGVVALIPALRAKSRTRVLAFIVLLLAAGMAISMYARHQALMERYRKTDQLPTRPDRPLDEPLRFPDNGG
jgi:hypothetical protein